MGAFGELLKQRWGYYNQENYKTKPPKQITKEQQLEIDKYQLNQIIYTSEQIREKLANRIKTLNEDNSEEIFKTEECQIEYEKWKKSFINETLTVFNLLFKK